MPLKHTIWVCLHSVVEHNRVIPKQTAAKLIAKLDAAALYWCRALLELRDLLYNFQTAQHRQTRISQRQIRYLCTTVLGAEQTC